MKVVSKNTMKNLVQSNAIEHRALQQNIAGGLRCASVLSFHITGDKYGRKIQLVSCNKLRLLIVFCFVLLCFFCSSTVYVINNAYVPK